MWNFDIMRHTEFLLQTRARKEESLTSGFKSQWIAAAMAGNVSLDDSMMRKETGFSTMTSTLPVLEAHRPRSMEGTRRGFRLPSFSGSLPSLHEIERRVANKLSSDKAASEVGVTKPLWPLDESTLPWEKKEKVDGGGKGGG